MKKILLLLALMGCDDRKVRVENYLGPNAVCAQDNGLFVCRQQVGDDTFTVLCISDKFTSSWVLCANFPTYDPPKPQNTCSTTQH